MSGRLSNVSFNLVDWPAFCALHREMPQRLEAFLCALELPEATEFDRAVIQRLYAGEFPKILESTFLLRGLRVDRQEFAARAAQLYANGPDWIAWQLEEVAFLGGNTRMGGDLCIDASTVACCVDSNFAERWGAFFDEEMTDAPPFVPFQSAKPLVRVLGLTRDDALDPVDNTFEPAMVAELADALDQLSPRSFVPQPWVRRTLERLGWDESVSGPIDRYVAQSIDEIRALFGRARALGMGVDVHWHPNP